MHCPTGYTTLVEMFDAIRGNPSANVAFGNAVAKLNAVLAATPDGRIIKLNPGTVYRFDQDDSFSFAFIDTQTWVVSLEKVRLAAQGLGSSLNAGAAILIANWDDTDGTIGWPVQPSLAQTLERFEGHSLVMDDNQAEGWISDVTEKSLVIPALPKPEPVNHKDWTSLSEAFDKAIHEYPNKTTQPKFEEWFRGFNTLRSKRIPDTEFRKLWPLAPDQWKGAGRPPNSNKPKE